MALGATYKEFHGVVNVHPAGGEGANDAALELDQRFAGLIAIAVTMGHGLDGGGHGVNIPQHPHENVQLVGAEIAKGADAGDFWVGHPAPFGIEPAAEGTVVAVGGAHAGDDAEIAGGDFVFQEDVFRIRPGEITGGEQQAGLLDGVGHGHAFMAGDAERLFHEHMLAGFRGGEHQLMVPGGLGEHYNGGDFRVRPDHIQVGHRLRVDFLGPAGGAFGVVIPNILDDDIRAFLADVQVTGSMDVGHAHEGNRDFLRVLRPRRQGGGRQGDHPGSRDEFATGKISLHVQDSAKPLRLSRLMNWAASGALVATMFGPSHSSFLPTRRETQPSSMISVSCAPTAMRE